jgi:hypothetical protein
VEISESAAEEAREQIGDGRILLGPVESMRSIVGRFDVCVLLDVIEHVREPVAFLGIIREMLEPDGVLLVATPSLDSWSARLMRERWMEFKPEHLTYFDKSTIGNALFRTGYRQVVIQPGWKMLNLSYVAHHFSRFSVPILTPLLLSVAKLTPQRIREGNCWVVPSGMTVLARAGSPAPRHKVSVIVPAYNEAATFQTMIEGLLRKQLPDLDMELVIVESNSTDSTREIALRYKDHPQVRLVLEDRPRGKGHAVRTGFAYASGDFVLIQDADLEYDLEDYDALLEPLVHGSAAFVLGARHGGTAWKMRRFTNRWLLSIALNAGHWFFTMLVNVLFGLRLKDPFTMFKVFRRDCLVGLRFECNRFDFDYELLIKLVRKGFRPIEIPVNYRSRSFNEGKKVTLWRDPVSWLWVLLRLRMTRIDPLRELEREQVRR